MSSTLVLIVLVSATLHPLWNMLIKRESDSRAVYVTFCAAFAFYALIHGLLSRADFAKIIEVWPLVLLSLGGQILYGTALVSTLKRGDLSSYYPIIRASPLVIILINVLVFSIDYRLIVLVGIAAILVGSFVLQYRRGTHFFSDPLTLFFAILAMSGSALYSLADARMMQSIEAPVLLFFVEILCVPIYAGIYFYNSRDIVRRSGIRAVAGKLWNINCFFYAALAYSSYYLILLAYRLGGEVAMVTSLRQASVPLSVLLGGMYLREGAIARRLTASLILAAGIIIIVIA